MGDWSASGGFLRLNCRQLIVCEPPLLFYDLRWFSSMSTAHSRNGNLLSLVSSLVNFVFIHWIEVVSDQWRLLLLWCLNLTQVSSTYLHLSLGAITLKEPKALLSTSSIYSLAIMVNTGESMAYWYLLLYLKYVVVRQWSNSMQIGIWVKAGSVV